MDEAADPDRVVVAAASGDPSGNAPGPDVPSGPVHAPGAGQPTTPPPDVVWVVDGANVVGSRPDGWWRDRPGAARRLHGRLVELVRDGDTGGAAVVLVLEGAARAGVDAGDQGGFRVVHAPGEGDDTVVGCTSPLRDEGLAVVVVTADRGLRARVTALGAEVRGPSWLP